MPPIVYAVIAIFAILAFLWWTSKPAVSVATTITGPGLVASPDGRLGVPMSAPTAPSRATKSVAASSVSNGPRRAVYYSGLNCTGTSVTVKPQPALNHCKNCFDACGNKLHAASPVKLDGKYIWNSTGGPSPAKSFRLLGPSSASLDNECSGEWNYNKAPSMPNVQSGTCVNTSPLAIVWKG